MLSTEAKISLKVFLGTACTFFTICMFIYYCSITNLVVHAVITILFAVNVYFLLRFAYNDFAFGVSTSIPILNNNKLIVFFICRLPSELLFWDWF